MGASFDDRAVETIHPGCRLPCAATGHLGDRGELVLVIARIDAFRAVATIKTLRLKAGQIRSPESARTPLPWLPDTRCSRK